MKFRNHFNHLEFDQDNEKFTLPSLTQPNQALSVRELLHRFTNGKPLSGKMATYEDDEQDFNYPINWDKMDISEKHDFMQERAQELQELTRKAQEKQNELRKKQEEDRIEREVQRKIQATRDSRKTDPPTRTQAQLPLDSE